MKKPLFLLVIPLVILAVACQPEPLSYQAHYQSLTEAIYSTVTVVPETLYTVYAPVNGIIGRSYLTEGKMVRKGDVLFQVDNHQSTLNQANAQLNLQIAEDIYSGEGALLRELEQGIEAARSKVAHDSLNFIRQANLWAQNIGARQAYDAKKLAYELAKNELNSLLRNYQRTKQELAHRLQQANNTLRINAANTAEFSVKSRLTGTVYDVQKEEGEFVSPQSPVATIGSTHHFVLRMLIDEVDIAQVFPGQKTIVNLDAYGKQVFEAEVTRIYPTKDQRSQTFTVEAVFKDQPTRLFNGLSGEANIIITEKEQVLCLPSQLINANNEVRTPEGLVPIKTGIHNLEFTEITSGIDTSTTIYQLE